MNRVTVTDVKHWNDRTFSIRTKRNREFRFRSGEFAMIGLEVDGKPLLRAYSVASANHEDHLEFLSIKVQDGPLTSRLQHIKPGEEIIVMPKTTGTLVTDFLLEGRNLFLLATGTGLAPFMSIIKDPTTYRQFEKVILVHTVRTEAELAYRTFLDGLTTDEVYGEFTQGQFFYVPTVTRGTTQDQLEDGSAAQFKAISGRCTDLMEQDDITKLLGLPSADPARDRVMACGSMAMNQQVIDWCDAQGYQCGTNSQAGTYVYEKAFVD